MNKWLAKLERLRDRFDPSFAKAKSALLARLEHSSLASASAVRRLHEVLCFMRAYPDNATVLSHVERMLASFERRSDLVRFRDDLARSGITGTKTWYPFFYPTALWLARRWPRRLRFDRTDAEAQESIARVLPLLLAPIEAAALRELNLPGYQAIDRVRGTTSDATFLVERIAAMPGNAFTREHVYDSINPSCELEPGADTPARSREKFLATPVVFQTALIRRTRPDLREQIARAPRAVKRCSQTTGQHLLDLARAAMVVRERDLDAFAYGNARDVWIVDDGDGLAFAVIGVEPERRAPVAAMYGALTLRNGVPIGYVQVDLVGRAAAVSFNTFETFRGFEAAFVFARLLAMVHHMFGAASFSIEPYQLGKDNDEGIESGAWWFYFKLGFRPRASDVLSVARAEQARMRARPKHRSNSATLMRLAERHLFFELDPLHQSPLPALPPHVFGARGSDRVQEAARRAGVSLRSWSAAERRVWEIWAPLVLLLPLARWSAGERRAFIRIVRAKAATSEREYISRFAAHAKLQRALLRQGANA